MTYEETIGALADKFGIDGLEAEDGKVALSIDGMDALLSDGGRGMLVATGYLGVPPPEGQLEFANMLLDANIDLKDTRDAAFARNPETGVYVFVERIALDEIGFDEFCERLGEFVNTLSAWREALDDYRPAAAAAKEVADDEPQAPFSPGDFMQV